MALDLVIVTLFSMIIQASCAVRTDFYGQNSEIGVDLSISKNTSSLLPDPPESVVHAHFATSVDVHDGLVDVHSALGYIMRGVYYAAAVVTALLVAVALVFRCTTANWRSCMFAAAFSCVCSLTPRRIGVMLLFVGTLSFVRGVWLMLPTHTFYYFNLAIMAFRQIVINNPDRVTDFAFAALGCVALIVGGTLCTSDPRWFARVLLCFALRAFRRSMNVTLVITLLYITTSLLSALRPYERLQMFAASMSVDAEWRAEVLPACWTIVGIALVFRDVRRRAAELTRGLAAGGCWLSFFMLCWHIIVEVPANTRRFDHAVDTVEAVVTALASAWARLSMRLTIAGAEGTLQGIVAGLSGPIPFFASVLYAVPAVWKVASSVLPVPPWMTRVAAVVSDASTPAAALMGSAGAVAGSLRGGDSPMASVLEVGPAAASRIVDFIRSTVCDDSAPRCDASASAPGATQHASGTGVRAVRTAVATAAPTPSHSGVVGAASLVGRSTRVPPPVDAPLVASPGPARDSIPLPRASTSAAVSRWGRICPLESVVTSFVDPTPAVKLLLPKLGARLAAAGPLAASQAIGLLLEVGADADARVRKLDTLDLKAIERVGRVGRRFRDATADGDVCTRAVRALAGGQPGAALDALCRDPEPQARTVDSLRDDVRVLFPAVRDTDVVPVVLADLAAPGGISRVRSAVSGDDRPTWVSLVEQTVRDGSRCAAPGVTGFRTSWLHTMIRDRASLEAIATWVDGLLLGHDPDLLRSVRLSLIPKGGGKTGSRPIGVGESIANVAKRVALRLLDRTAPSALASGAQWCGEKDACRELAGVLQAAHTSGLSLLSLDVKNAFNCVDRCAVVAEVEAVCPDVAPFVRWCLQATPMIVSGLGKHEVRRGVVQGDPMSSTLFALVMAGVARKVAASCSAVGVSVVLLAPGAGARTQLASVGHGCVALGAYADDCTLVWSDPDALCTVVDAITRALADVGLSAEPSKSFIVAGDGVDDAFVQSTASRLVGVKVVAAAKFVGVPIGETAAARALLMSAVAAASAKLSRGHVLKRPMAEAAFLHHCGMSAQLQFILPACGSDVVDASVLDAIATHEDALMRHVFGVHAARVTNVHLNIACRPLAAGGLGWQRVDDLGKLDDGVWRRFTADEYAAHRADTEARVDAAVAADRAWQRRWRELKSGGVVPWFDSSVALRVRAYDRGVEEFALAAALGVPVVPQRLVGRACPEAHLHRFPVHDGTSAHLEQCAKRITHRRHDATKRQLAQEIRDALSSKSGLTGWEVDCEIGLGRDGQLERRKKGAEQFRQRILGDVYVSGFRDARMFLDVGWKSVCGAGVLAGLPSASEKVFAEKTAAFDEWRPVVGPNSDIVYIPVAISTSGVVHRQSIVELDCFGLSKAAWKRIVAVGMMTQATEAVSLLNRMAVDAKARDDARAAGQLDAVSVVGDIDEAVAADVLYVGGEQPDLPDDEQPAADAAPAAARGRGRGRAGGRAPGRGAAGGRAGSGAAGVASADGGGSAGAAVHHASGIAAAAAVPAPGRGAPAVHSNHAHGRGGRVHDGGAGVASAHAAGGGSASVNAHHAGGPAAAAAALAPGRGAAAAHSQHAHGRGGRADGSAVHVALPSGVRAAGRAGRGGRPPLRHAHPAPAAASARRFGVPPVAAGAARAPSNVASH